MAGIFGKSFQRSKQSVSAISEQSFGVAQTTKRPAGPLTGVLGQELRNLQEREAALRSAGNLGEPLRDVQERITELQNGIAAVES